MATKRESNMYSKGQKLGKDDKGKPVVVKMDGKDKDDKAKKPVAEGEQI